MERLSNFEGYTAEQFAADESFQSYVFRTNEEAIAFWESFIKSQPEAEPQIREATRLLSLLNFEAIRVSQEVKSVELERLLASLPKRNQALLMSSRVNLWRIAACIVAIASLFFVGYLTLPSRMATYQTAYGEHATVVLPDGTVVTLNGNSTLRHEDNWNGHSIREVWLEGEAFFDVKHRGTSQDARFIVHIPDMEVEVLGTRFNVFNRNDKANVILNSGKVKVRVATAADTSTVLLMPDQALEFSRGEGKLTRKNVKAEKLTSWRNNLLIFDNTPLSEIGEIIEQTYGLKVTFAEGVDITEKLAGTVPSENLDVLIKVLATSSNLSITKQKDEIVISKVDRE